jgi:hypothetical protein
MRQKLKQFDYKNPPWSTKYPKLVNILEERPAEPLGNVIGGNVLVRCNRRPLDEQYVKLANNFRTEEDPGFYDAAGLDFRLKSDSVVYEKVEGFEPIPFEKIGLYQDEYRATWPVKRAQ